MNRSRRSRDSKFGESQTWNSKADRALHAVESACMKHTVQYGIAGEVQGRPDRRMPSLVPLQEIGEVRGRFHLWKRLYDLYAK